MYSTPNFPSWQYLSMQPYFSWLYGSLRASRLNVGKFLFLQFSRLAGTTSEKSFITRIQENLISRGEFGRENSDLFFPIFPFRDEEAFEIFSEYQFII